MNFGRVPFIDADYEYRHCPIVYCPRTKGWIQSRRQLRQTKPTQKHLVWPKDGRMDTPWGRFKDILKGQGPDMYVTGSNNKRDCNRPSRAQWSGWKHLEEGRDLETIPSRNPCFWTRRGLLGGREPGKSYDFRTRKYCYPNIDTWSNAVWQPDQSNNKYARYPEAVRDVYGQWYQDIHYPPRWRGGPIIRR